MYVCFQAVNGYLFLIFQSFAEREHYVIEQEAASALTGMFREAVKQRDERFGNGRFVRNLFQETISRQALRLAEQGGESSLEDLQLLKLEDVPKELLPLTR